MWNEEHVNEIGKRRKKGGRGWKKCKFELTRRKIGDANIDGSTSDWYNKFLWKWW